MITSNKFVVTLSALRKADACISGYNRLVRALQGREFTNEDDATDHYLHIIYNDPISIRYIVDSNNMNDALWALRCIDDPYNDRDIRLFIVWCARQVEYLMCDPRSKNALDMAERYANGEATDAELYVAWTAAREVTRTIFSDATWAAVLATSSNAVWFSVKASASASVTARAIALAAARAIAADSATNSDAAQAWTTARNTQKNRLIEMLEAGAFIGSTQPK